MLTTWQQLADMLVLSRGHTSFPLFQITALSPNPFKRPRPQLMQKFKVKKVSLNQNSHGARSGDSAEWERDRGVVMNECCYWKIKYNVKFELWAFSVSFSYPFIRIQGVPTNNRKRSTQNNFSLIGSNLSTTKNAPLELHPSKCGHPNQFLQHNF